MKLTPIGIIHTPFKQAAGTPIQPSVADGAEGTVEVFPDYAEGLRDLDGFDRIWLLYWFDRAREPRMLVKPYMDTVKHGIFAVRAPARPNPIGLSCVRLVAVDGAMLSVADIDILDGTPLLDIKPYVPRFDRFDVERSGWLDHIGSHTGRADSRFEQKNNERNN